MQQVQIMRPENPGVGLEVVVRATDLQKQRLPPEQSTRVATEQIQTHFGTCSVLALRSSHSVMNSNRDFRGSYQVQSPQHTLLQPGLYVYSLSVRQ